MTSDDGGRGPNFEGAGAALEFARWGLVQQQQALRGFDAKSERALTLAVAILAIFSAASTFFLGADTFFRGADTFGVSNRLPWLIASGALLLSFFAVAGLFFHSQAAISMHLGPDGEHLLEISAAHTDLRTRQWLAENIYQSIENNEGAIATRSRRYKRLAFAVLVEALAAGVAIAAGVSS